MAAVAEKKSRRPAGTFTTGDLARLTENTLRTVRHYEELGLICPLDREEGGHRLFNEIQLERLRFITDMRSLSFPLASIREVLSCRDDAASPCQAAKRAASALDGHIQELKEKIRTLRRVRDTLVRTRATLEECADCDESWETRYCDDCEVRPDESPRLVELLW